MSEESVPPKKGRAAYGPDRTGRAKNRGGAEQPATSRSGAKGRPSSAVGSGSRTGARSSAPVRPSAPGGVRGADHRAGSPGRDVDGRSTTAPARTWRAGVGTGAVRGGSGAAASKERSGPERIAGGPARQGGRAVPSSTGRGVSPRSGDRYGSGDGPPGSGRNGQGPVFGAKQRAAGDRPADAGPSRGSGPGGARRTPERAGRAVGATPERAGRAAQVPPKRAGRVADASERRPGQAQPPDRPQRGWEIRDAATARASRGAWTPERPAARRPVADDERRSGELARGRGPSGRPRSEAERSCGTSRSVRG